MGAGKSLPALKKKDNKNEETKTDAQGKVES